MRLLPLLFLTLLSTCVRAQVDNFQPATLTTAAGETLTGFANGDGSLVLSKNVRFRADRNDAGGEQRYSARQVKALTFTESGDVYHPLEYRYTLVGDTVRRSEPRLAKLLYDGVYDLYTLDRGTGEFFNYGGQTKPGVFYIVDGDDAEILQIEQRPVEGSTLEFLFIEAFRGKLRYYFSDWPAAESAIQKMRYSERDFLEIFDRYTRFRNPEEAKTKIDGPRKKAPMFVHALFSPQSRYAEIDEANGSAFGLGVHVRSGIPSSNGLLEADFGAEVLWLDFNNAPQRNLRTELTSVVAVRIPLTANVYLMKNETLNLRFRGGGSLTFGAVRGIARSLLQQAVFNDLRIDVGFYGGLGVDFGRLAIDGGYSTRYGPLVSAGFRLR